MPQGTVNVAEEAHRELVRRYPMYEETAHWTPVKLSRKKLRENDLEIAKWFSDRNLVRGDNTSRNDWLFPASGLFLFKDNRTAVEFKLTWG